MFRALADYLVSTIILLLILNASLGIYYHLAHVYVAQDANRIFSRCPHLRESIQKVYPSMTEADVARLLNETLERSYDPQWFVGFGEAPFRGKFVNVAENGFRIGTNQGPWPPAHDGNFVVFLFGGSTTFGYMVTDDQALGSRLQLLLAKKLGRPVAIYNFGQASYFSTQERLLFEKLMMTGQKPDLAIFVDGLNDFHRPWAEMPFTPGTAPPWSKPLTQRAWLREGIGMLPMTRLAISLRGKLQNSAQQNASANSAEQNHKFDEQGPLLKAIDRYFLNKRMIEAEAREFSVRTLFVWQPVPTYEYDQQYDLFARDGYAGFTYSKYGYPLMRETVARAQPGNFLWCADIQKDEHEELYADIVHYSPKMTEMVAGCISDGVQ
jgi:hypothetical protein